MSLKEDVNILKRIVIIITLFFVFICFSPNKVIAKINKKFFVTYHLNGGINNKNPKQFSKRKVKLVTPNKKGFVFVGWYNQKGKKIKVLNHHNYNLYAKWRKIKKYKLILYSDANSTIKKKYFWNNKKTKLPKLSKGGYIFLGWYHSKRSKKVVKSIPYGTSKNIKLYAKWKIKNYKISYHYGGGKRVQNPSYYNIHSNIKLLDTTKEGYKFKGWFLKDRITQVESITKYYKGNLSLYAKWVKVPNATWISSYHRGRTIGSIAENTLESIQQAYINGSQYVEFDIQKTNDNVFVLSHDNNILLNVNGQPTMVDITKSNYSDIKDFYIANSSCKISTLYSVLTYAKSVGLFCNLDCKVGNLEDEKLIAKMVVDTGMSGSCIYNTWETSSISCALGIKSIDSHAGFVWRYTVVNNIPFDQLGIEVKKNFVWCPASEITQDVYNIIRSKGCSIMISNVDNNNYISAMNYKPDMIEFLSGVDANYLQKMYLTSLV